MKNRSAVALGKLGGQAKSPQKTASSRINGASGGRPAEKGVSNWVRFFDAVDSVRRTGHFGQLHHIARSTRITREKALVIAAARELAGELRLPFPSWAISPLVLGRPYFVSGMENLRATALQESPAQFRLSHVFVLGNFLSRV